MIGIDCYKVTGHTIREADFTPSERTDYEFLVSFKSTDDNKEKHENYLSWYENWKPEEDGRPWHFFCPEMCAIALVTMHLRESMIRLKGDKAERAFPAGLPEKAPDAQDTGHKLWVVSKASTEIYTESNAAWDLYERCQYTKLSIADAKALVLPKFEGRYCSWDYILERFRKLGGRHTDLYLRVDR